MSRGLTEGVLGVAIYERIRVGTKWGLSGFPKDILLKQ